MNPDEAELQTFENLNRERNFWITFKTPEFTSLIHLPGNLILLITLTTSQMKKL